MLYPITLAVKPQRCIYKTFPLSRHWDRQSNAKGKGGGMPDFKPTPNFASPLPAPFAALSRGGSRAEGSSSAAEDGGTSLACLARPSGLA